jgi:hypothetical protein
MILAFY